MRFSNFDILLFFTRLTLKLSAGGGEKKKTLLGNIHEQAFELNKAPKFVPQRDVEEEDICATTIHRLGNTALIQLLRYFHV